MGCGASKAWSGAAYSTTMLKKFHQQAAVAELEGILPALESSHAVAWVLEQAEALRGRRVLVNMSGRGDKDLESVIRANAAREARS